jgi:Fic family protein
MVIQMTQSRTYEKTHPWITFAANIERLDAKTWVMLGECQSKCEHLAGTPLEPATAQELYKVYLAKGVAATTAIESNTLTEKEVQDRIEGKLELPPSQEYLGQEIDNIVQACAQLALRACAPGSIAHFSVDDIKEYNRMVLRNLIVKDAGMPGEVSRHMVVVGRYRGAPR